MRNKKLVLCIFLIILVNLTIVISEEITDSSAKLDLGDGLIATVCTEPMKVKKNPTR